jgi:hypothetical protein
MLMQNAECKERHTLREIRTLVTHRTVSDQITPYSGFLPPRKEIGGAAQDDGAGRRTDQIQYEET